VLAPGKQPWVVFNTLKLKMVGEANTYGIFRGVFGFCETSYLNSMKG